jgi:hypothetical protein
MLLQFERIADDPACEAARDDQEGRDHEGRDKPEDGIDDDQHDRHDEEHHEVGERDRKHREDHAELGEVRRCPRHEIPGGCHIMEIERHPLDVREYLIPEISLGTIRELEAEVAPKGDADGLDHTGSHEQTEEGPHERHVPVDHRGIDHRADKIWDGHNRCHPHSSTKNRNRCDRPIFGEDPPQQRDAVAKIREA